MDRVDRLLIGLAAGWLAFVAIGVTGPDFHSSADRVSDGDVWLLFTSALRIVPELGLPQWILLATAVCVVIWRHGPKLWWSIALAGHVGAALISYAVIGLAIWLGSTSADKTAGQADYGVSIVLAATLGALAAGGFAVSPESRSRADKTCIGLGLLGLAGMIVFSVGWYDMQHVIGFSIGFLLTGLILNRGYFPWSRPQVSRRSK